MNALAPNRAAKAARATMTPRTLRIQSRLHATFGVAGLSFAGYMIYPKALALFAGDLSVLGVGAVANLGLVFGSLMFLRNAAIFRRQASRTLGDTG